MLLKCKVIGLNIIGFSIIIWKFVVLLMARIKQNEIIENILNFVNTNNDELNIKSLDNILTKEISKLECGLNTIQIIATISPFLGLLGTVIGVLRIDEDVSYKRIVKVLDMLKKYGFNNLSLVTKNESDK